MAVNRAVPLMYPKVRAKVGERRCTWTPRAVTSWWSSPSTSWQVARGGYVAQAYRDRIGFEVAKALLERAVRETYAIELDDLLLNVDLAIGTYRRAVSKTIPELTRIAWRDKREEIEQRTPGVTEQAFVFSLSPRDYEREFGTKYRKPGIFARILAFVLKILPKVGPLRPLAFEPLTTEAERLFLESVTAARTRYRALLQELRPALFSPNTDFDTGGPAAFGQNRLADETYADLLHKLARRNFADVSPELRRHLNGFFASTSPSREGASRKEVSRIRSELVLMNGS